MGMVSSADGRITLNQKNGANSSEVSEAPVQNSNLMYILVAMLFFIIVVYSLLKRKVMVNFEF